MTSGRFGLRVVSISKVLLLCAVAAYGPTSGRYAAWADDGTEPVGPSLTAPAVGRAGRNARTCAAEPQ